jgi:hypothetical protein
MPLQTINTGASANDGTGDPLRTAFDKVNDNFLAVSGGVFNVKDPAYGAVGDGVTDDTAAINACVDAVRDAVSTARIPQGATVTLNFGSGEFRVDGSIDMTAIRAINLLIEGGGAIINAHCSGKPVIDMLDFPIGGFSPPEGRLACGFKPPAFSRFLFQSAVKSAESF